MIDFLSIEKFSEQLGVSPATVRRRIKKGELKAVKRPGPYGEQYFIPTSEVTAAQEITDVVPVDKRLTVQELAHFINLAIRKENEDLHQEIKELRQELVNFRQAQEARDIQVVAQIRAIVGEKKKPWWSRLFG